MRQRAEVPPEYALPHHSVTRCLTGGETGGMLPKGSGNAMDKGREKEYNNT